MIFVPWEQFSNNPDHVRLFFLEKLASGISTPGFKKNFLDKFNYSPEVLINYLNSRTVSDLNHIFEADQSFYVDWQIVAKRLYQEQMTLEAYSLAQTLNKEFQSFHPKFEEKTLIQYLYLFLGKSQFRIDLDNYRWHQFLETKKVS